MIFFDLESIGLMGPTVLIQWAEDDGPVQLHSVWTEPAQATIELIERFCSDPGGVVGFNLAFDWFHLAQTYTTLLLLPDRDAEPQDCVEEYAELEPLARDGPCLKPASACDVMLVARRGPYQSTMDRGDVRVRRVPTALAWQLAAELEARVQLKDIYFARRKRDRRGPKWQVLDVEDADGDDFKDVVLRFAPSSALKALAVDALGIEQDSVLLFADLGLPAKAMPVELGYAPFARAIGSRHDWKGAWPDVIRHHVSHWAYGTLARKYAGDDVEYTRALYRHFGSPELGDDDSVLACMVGAVRWRGFRVDVAGLRELRGRTLARKTKLVDGREFKIPTSPEKARIYVSEVMDEVERLGARAGLDAEFRISTKKVLLEEIAKWRRECPECGGEGSTKREMPEGWISKARCERCDGGGLVDHPAASRAAEVLGARQAQYEVDLYDKFLLAGRFHASFNVIGTLSSRMCLPGGEWVLTSGGARRVRDLVGRPFVAVCNGHRHGSAGFHATGEAEVFEVATSEGHRLRATANHPVKVRYGDLEMWQPVSNLRAGDSVLLHDHGDAEWGGWGSWADGYLLGRQRDGRVVLRYEDFCMVDFVTRLTRPRGTASYDERSVLYVVTSPRLAASHSSLEEGSSELLRGFASGLFDAIGGTSPTIGIEQADLGTLELAQRVLLRLGINSTISGGHRLRLRGSNASRFVSRVGFRHPVKVTRAMELVGKEERELFQATVRSVTSVGVQAVYDVSVPDTGYFDASGFVVHNSGGDQLNSQGIKKTKEVRSKFPLAWPGYTLCVPGDQWTLTSEGPREVRRLIGQACTLVINGAKYRTDGFFSSGEREVFEVETVEGHRFQATSNHPVLVDYPDRTCGIGLRLWQEVDKLRVNDRICLHNHSNFEWDGDGDWSEGYLLGWMFGDGCYSQKRDCKTVSNDLQLNPDDHCLLDFILKQFNVLPNLSYNVEKDIYRIYSSEFESIRLKFGVDDLKEVNTFIESASSDFLSGFLSAFFDTDGSASKERVCITLSQSNLARLEAVQRILLKFGINSSIIKTANAGEAIIIGKHCQVNAKYSLSIRKANVVTFVARIGFRNPYKREVSLRLLAERTVQYKRTEKFAESFTARVKSIRSVGVKPVYDVQVPEAKCFDLNGVVAHNCGGDFQRVRSLYR